MGAEVWDTLEGAGLLTPGLMEAYETLVEALYGGDSTGVEEPERSKGGKRSTSGWPFKDTRVLGVKVWADTFAARVAKGVREAQGQGPQ